MVAPKAPKLWKAILLIPSGVLIIIYFGFCSGWNLNRVAQGTGIFIDILWLVIIAIPDLPVLHKHFFSGKLESAIDKLRFENEGSAPNDIADPNAGEKLIKALTAVQYAQNVPVAELLKGRVG